MDKIDVLDHGFVRLVDSMGSDLSVVRAARVSYDAAWRTGEDQGSDTRLINYLLKDLHTTPFEAVTLTFEVKAPIFVRPAVAPAPNVELRPGRAPVTANCLRNSMCRGRDIGVQSKSNKQARELTGENMPATTSLQQPAPTPSWRIASFWMRDAARAGAFCAADGDLLPHVRDSRSAELCLSSCAALPRARPG